MKKSISFVSSIFFATFTSIFESISSKCSNLLIATHRTILKSMKKLLVNLFTFSISFSRKSVSKHQKFYFIIDDLICMFHEKSKSFDLYSHRKCFVFSQRFDIRSSSQSRFFINHESRSISSLQSIRKHRLIKFEKLEFEEFSAIYVCEIDSLCSVKEIDLFFKKNINAKDF